MEDTWLTQDQKVGEGMLGRNTPVTGNSGCGVRREDPVDVKGREWGATLGLGLEGTLLARESY